MKPWALMMRLCALLLAPVVMQAVAAMPERIFVGTESEAWLPVQFEGGNFAKFARFGGGTLMVDVPAGSGWGTTGLRSAAPVVGLPHPLAGETQRLTVLLDAEHSGSVFLSLVPPLRAAEDEHRAYDLRFGILTPADGPVEAVLWADRREQGRRVIERRARLDRVTFVLRADGVVLVEDADGEKLFEALLPRVIPAQGWHLHAVAKAPAGNQPARLVLREVSVERSALPQAGDPQVLAADLGEPVTLFDGRLLGHRWSLFQTRGGNLQSDVRFLPGAMKVTLPDGHNGPLGIYTDAALFWLDHFTAGAETRLDFDFVAEETTAFTLALAGARNLNGNKPNNYGLMIEWQALAEGETETVTVIKLSPPQIRVRSAKVPQQLRLVLAPGQFWIEAEGFPAQPFVWDELVGGQGLRAYVFLERPGADRPASLALRGVTMTRVPGWVSADEAPPMAGIDALPKRVVFDGRPGRWQTFGLAGADANLADISAGILSIALDGEARDATAGILSAEPLIQLDERIRRTPFRITHQFVPAATTAFNLLITGQADPKAARGAYQLGVSLAPAAAGAGPHEGQMLLTLHDSGVYNIWQRPIDPAYLAANWDGRVLLDLGEERATVTLPGVTRLSARVTRLYPFSAHRLMVNARPQKALGPIALQLKWITTGWVTPPLMDALERFELVDLDAFDAAAYIETLSREMPEARP